MIIDEFLMNSIQPPLIPQELSAEQVNECKEWAKQSVIERYPVLSDRQSRKELSKIDKFNVLALLNEAFEYKADLLLGRI